MKTYNKAVFMPSHALYGKTYRLNYSRHALEAMTTDRYGIIKPVASVKIDRVNLVELTLNDYRNPVKLLVRMPQNSLADVCLILIPDYDLAFCKTAWLCSAEDNHQTLNREFYATN